MRQPMTSPGPLPRSNSVYGGDHSAEAEDFIASHEAFRATCRLITDDGIELDDAGIPIASLHRGRRAISDTGMPPKTP